jgi:CheY-like chemotaxis protein
MSAMILIIEDDEDIRESLKELLEDEGYSVASSGNGREALEYLRSTTELPHLILLDLMMPVMDGYAFRAEQKSDETISKIPVIVMSADVRAEAKAAELQAVEIARKPLGIKAILELIHRHCR